MRLNTLKVSKATKRRKKRVGRGSASGKGKTCGRGMKGQLSRSGGKVKRGFEGGQMPIQRRLPKFGFNSRKALSRCEIKLYQLDQLNIDMITIDSLRKAKLIPSRIKYVKVIVKGNITRPVTIKGIKVTAKARQLIEIAGGKIVDDLMT